MADLVQELAKHQALRAQLLEEFPELAEDQQTLADTLEGVSSLDDAIAAVIHQVEDDEAMILGCNNRIQQLSGRVDRLQSRIGRLREIIAKTMDEVALKKIQRPDFSVSLVPTRQTVVITDETAIPPDYMTTPKPPAPKPDKRLIEKALKDGYAVPGCQLSNGSQTIRINRG